MKAERTFKAEVVENQGLRPRGTSSEATVCGRRSWLAVILSEYQRAIQTYWSFTKHDQKGQSW